MKVIPLAAESLGVRSMATYVEVGGTGILIDPGATLAPARFGLPPAGGGGGERRAGYRSHLAVGARVELHLREPLSRGSLPVRSRDVRRAARAGEGSSAHDR